MVSSTENQSIISRLYLLAFLLSITIVVALPGAYFWMSYRFQDNEMQIEAKLYSVLISQHIIAKPQNWQFEALDLLDEDLTETNLPELRAIYAPDGKAIAMSSVPLGGYPLERSLDLADEQGHIVARISVSRDITPLLTKAALLGLISLAMGMAIFVILYTLPLRALRQTLQDMQREKRIAQSNEEQLRVIIDTADEGIITLNQAGNIKSFNNASEAIFGHQASDILNHPVQQIFPQLKSIVAGHSETNALHRDGTDFPVELTISIAHLQMEVQYVCLVRNITERKQNEFELKQHRDHLQELVDERTADLSAAKDAAESANHAKSTFLSTMSHEIRTPISAILGMTMLALKTELTEKQRDYIQKTQQAGQHLMLIINEILDYSKIEEGKLLVEHIEFNLDELLQNVCNITLESAARKGLQVTVDTGGMPSKLTGDPLRLTQVLINLTGNAVKFTPKGNIQIRVRTINRQQPTVRFEVQDSGVGIDPVVLPHLFRPFQQADATISRKFGGTGLGLAICKQLVSLMGGEIGVDSTPGKGSTFWFTLPLGQHAANLPPISDMTETGLETTSLDGIHILLAEDNEFNQEIATELLEDAGAIVHLACNGIEAIELLKNQHIDLVLMDLQMPEMDGLEATRRIRANPATAGLHIIAMTANASKLDQEACMAAGMNDFISKPIELDMFFGTLSRWLHHTPPSSTDKA